MSAVEKNLQAPITISEPIDPLILPEGSWQKTAMIKGIRRQGVYLVLEATLEGENGLWHDAMTKFVPGQKFANINGKFVIEE